MGVLGVFEGCLKCVWKNKIEVWNQSDHPHPVYEIISQKIFISRMTPSLIIWWWQWQRHTKKQIQRQQQIQSVSFIIDSMYAMLKLQIPYRCWWPLDVSDLLQAVAKILFLGDSVQHHCLCSCCPVCTTPAFMNVTKRPEFGKIISTEFNPERRTSTPEPIFAAYSFISSSVSAS